MLPLLRNRKLVPIVDGTSQCPPAFLKHSDGNILDTVNPAFEAWIQRDGNFFSFSAMASSDSSSPTLPIPPLPNVSNFLTINLVPIFDGTSQCPAAFFKNSDVNITDTVNPAFEAWIDGVK
ncbi:hypothetical protein TB2_035982 [Malus domestica]